MRRVSLILFIAAASLPAADQALLIGVGQYPNPQNNLKGIEKDVEIARSWAQQMGIAQVKVLFNEEAKLARIYAELNRIARETRPGDRIFIYFSGHGSLNRDAGRVQGVLVNYDMKLENGQLTNVLSGPELGRIISGMKSDAVLLVVDACHSGKLTESSKGLETGDDFMPKLLTYEGMPEDEAEISLSKGMHEVSSRINYLLLSACRRDELADATKDGSRFTVALSAAMESLRKRKLPISARQLLPVTDAEIASAQQKVKGQQTQHPESYGDQTLHSADWFNKGMNVCPSIQSPTAAGLIEPTGDKRWDSMNRLAKSGECALSVRSVKAQYRNDEALQLHVEVPENGYLSVIGYGEGGANATVLFPNGLATNNAVKKGRLALGDNAATSFEVGLVVPSGMQRQNNIVVAVFSKTPFDLNRWASGEGTFKEVPFNSDDRDFAIRPKKESGRSAAAPPYASGRAVFVIMK